MQYAKEYRQLTQHAAPDFDSVNDIIEEGLPLSAVPQSVRSQRQITIKGI